jgi:hypothetical protein
MPNLQPRWPRAGLTFIDTAANRPAESCPGPSWPAELGRKGGRGEGQPRSRTTASKFSRRLHLRSRRPLFSFIVWGAAALQVIISILALKYSSAPYVVILASCATLAAVCCFSARDSIHRCLFYNAGFVSVFICGLEIYAYLSEAAPLIRYETLHGVNDQPYTVSSEILGYAPVPNTAFRARRYDGTELTYDVVYTIGPTGLRKSSSASRKSEHCVLFFGDSFTFGEGVEDFETMPYVVGTLFDWVIYNFGFHGYGPHQMLSALQHGMVERRIECTPRFVIYQALPAHVARAAGYTTWDEHGPKYIVRDGQVEYAGHFDDGQARQTYLYDRMYKQLLKSHLYMRLMNRYSADEKDIGLFSGIVGASRDEIEQRFPEAEFHVLFWDVDDDGGLCRVNPCRGAIEALQGELVTLHRASTVLPGLAEGKGQYEISRYDRHPNALAHRLIAEYVVEHIVDG